MSSFTLRSFGIGQQLKNDCFITSLSFPSMTSLSSVTLFCLHNILVTSGAEIFADGDHFCIKKYSNFPRGILQMNLCGRLT